MRLEILLLMLSGICFWNMGTFFMSMINQARAGSINREGLAVHILAIVINYPGAFGFIYLTLLNGGL